MSSCTTGRHRVASCVLVAAALTSLSCGNDSRLAALPTASAAALQVPGAEARATDATADDSAGAAAADMAIAEPTSAPSGAAAPGENPQPPPPPTGPPSDLPPTQPSPVPPPPPVSGEGSDVRAADMYAFSCSNDEATVAASGAARVTLGSATVYAGTQQVSGNNQDPRVARFDNGTLSWCRDDLERSNDDGRAYGVLWSGDRLYVAFTATGSQGEESGDLRRFTTGGWLSSYSDASPGGGGGGKVSAIIALDPATGDGRTGSWLTALNNGKTNSLVVTSLALDGGGLRVGALSWFAPRGLDRTALLCTGGSPFAASYQFSADLSAVSAATAERCSTV